MPTIRILPDHVANQIAAGEVVERPAAVIKELLENSLDAGARRVEIEFANGGKSYMRVEDDGCGMSPDEALLALERHATSKIREAADLGRVLSFGFRGEALPSIASVSRFTLRSRPAGVAVGCEILVDAGRLIHRRECGMPQGTCMEVAQLFKSVPARRKFMKTDRTEAAHIVQGVRLYAVGHPEVSFALIEDGRSVFRSPVCRSLRERVGEIWGGALAGELEELAPVEQEGLRLSGLLGRPGVGRATRQELLVFVNGRPVDSRTVAFAVMESYQRHLPRGRFPAAFLFMEISPEWVDVNVHPAKREVRFRDEAGVRRVVAGAVAEHLAAVGRGVVAGCEGVEASGGGAAEVAEVSGSPVEVAGAVVAPPVVLGVGALAQRGGVEAPQMERVEKVERVEGVVRGGWRYIGVMDGGQVALLESGGGLVCLHLRAALERVRYEEIKRRLVRGGVSSQRLLMPQPVELDPVAAAAVEEHFGLLAGAGFGIEPFGRNYYRLEAVPDWMEPEDAVVFLRDLAGVLRERGGGLSHHALVHEHLARQAALSARLSGGMSEEEVRGLSARLLQCEQPLTCPRGRPTFYEIPRADMDRRLGRRFETFDAQNF